MLNEMFRPGFTTILVMALVFASLLALSEPAKAYSWTDDFSGPSLDSRWTRGGIGEVGIRQDSNTLHALSYTGNYTDIWHGPFIRSQMPTFADFDVRAQFRCIAMDMQMSRLMIRVIDQSGNQIFSFGWSDTMSTDSMASVGLFGDSFSDPIFQTKAAYTYANFYDKEIRLTRSSQEIHFYIEDTLVYNGSSSQTPGYFIDVAFLKYRDECTLDTLDLNRIFMSTAVDGVPVDDTNTTGDSPPSVPGNLASVNGSNSASLFWSPPADDGGSPILGYRIYCGDSPDNMSKQQELGPVQTFVDSGLENNKTYFYGVAAFNEFGEGPWANCSAKPRTVDVNFSDNSDDTLDPPSWTDNFSLTSSIIMVLALATGIGLAFLFMRGRGDAGIKKDRNSGKSKETKRKKKIRRR